MKQFDTSHKYITILGVKYRILDRDTVLRADSADRTSKAYQFNWDNISESEIEYSEN